MARVLLAGESWINAAIDHKGFDAFPNTKLDIGCKRLLADLRKAGHDVTHLRSHDVAADFPETIDELNAYDVVILSDIGANSLLLSPRVFAEGKTAPNRLKLLRDWVKQGGGLMMAGGYLSFQGFQAKANYAGTAVEEVLPVSIHRWDDRVETPEGATGCLSEANHPITAGLEQKWPALLGYQDLILKDDSVLLATIEDRPLLAIREVGDGRTLAYASDISPHWAPQEFMEWPGYATLFDRSVTWLAGE